MSGGNRSEVGRLVQLPFGKKWAAGDDRQTLVGQALVYPPNGGMQKGIGEKAVLLVVKYYEPGEDDEDGYYFCLAVNQPFPEQSGEVANFAALEKVYKTQIPEREKGRPYHFGGPEGPGQSGFLITPHDVVSGKHDGLVCGQFRVHFEPQAVAELLTKADEHPMIFATGGCRFPGYIVEGFADREVGHIIPCLLVPQHVFATEDHEKWGRVLRDNRINLAALSLSGNGIAYDGVRVFEVDGDGEAWESRFPGSLSSGP